MFKLGSPEILSFFLCTRLLVCVIIFLRKKSSYFHDSFPLTCNMLELLFLKRLHHCCIVIVSYRTACEVEPAVLLSHHYSHITAGFYSG